MDSCGADPNPDVGEPPLLYSPETQLYQMGRVCGGETYFGGSGDPWTMSVQLHLYETTPGAGEAYRREATQMLGSGGDPEIRQCREDAEGRLEAAADRDLLLAVGDERELTTNVGLIDHECSGDDEYVLLFRRRNVIARLELSNNLPTSEVSPDPVLEYAAQLDRNIEAAAQQQSQ